MYQLGKGSALKYLVDNNNLGYKLLHHLDSGLQAAVLSLLIDNSSRLHIYQILPTTMLLHNTNQVCNLWQMQIQLDNTVLWGISHQSLNQQVSQQCSCRDRNSRRCRVQLAQRVPSSGNTSQGRNPRRLSNLHMVSKCLPRIGTECLMSFQLGNNYPQGMESIYMSLMLQCSRSQLGIRGKKIGRAWADKCQRDSWLQGHCQSNNTILPCNSLQLVQVILSPVDSRNLLHKYLLEQLDLHSDSTYLQCIGCIGLQNLTSWYLRMFQQDMEQVSRLTQDNSSLRGMVQSCQQRRLIRDLA